MRIQRPQVRINCVHSLMVTLQYQMVQIGEFLHNTGILVSLLVKICVFNLPGCPYIGLPHTVLQLI